MYEEIFGVLKIHNRASIQTKTTDETKEEKFEDTTGVTRSHKSKKGRQYNGRQKKEIRTSNDL